jgi:hypothetical protein
MKHTKIVLTLSILALNVSGLAFGQTQVPNTFQAGQPARAAEVNDNFAILETAVNDNDGRIAALEAQIQALEALVTSLQAERVPNLSSYLRIDETDPQRPIAWFESVNVKIVNGSGTTAGAVNGLGNLIVGYDEDRGPGITDKSGSHNLVVGPAHNYTSYGGFVAGLSNTTSAPNASVIGGEANTASGASSSVTAGFINTASGLASSVTGGFFNTASGQYSSVSGGRSNEASGNETSVSGGSSNTASCCSSSVSGGTGNSASSSSSSISGGAGNISSGVASSVSGGIDNVASSVNSSVSGGRNRTAPSFDDWVAGGLFQDD